MGRRVTSTVTVTCFLAALPLRTLVSCPAAFGALTNRYAYTMSSEGEGDLRSHQSGTTALPSVTTHVGLVRKLFPDWGEEISRLALSNETFRDMCEEYGLAVEALDLLEQRNHPQDVDRMYEYRTLIKQLERDLKYELLAAYDPHRPRKV
jgi:hypothetical protein